MSNVFGATVNEKSTIECSDFLISILKSSTPKIDTHTLTFNFSTVVDAFYVEYINNTLG